jgi:hypothetical protein
MVTMEELCRRAAGGKVVKAVQANRRNRFLRTRVGEQ